MWVSPSFSFSNSINSFLRMYLPFYSTLAPSSFFLSDFFLSLFILSSRPNFLLSMIVSTFYSFSTPSSPDRFLLSPSLFFSLISRIRSIFTMIVFPFHSSIAVSSSDMFYPFLSFFHSLLSTSLFFFYNCIPFLQFFCFYFSHPLFA